MVAGGSREYKHQELNEDNSQVMDGTLNTEMNSQRSSNAGSSGRPSRPRHQESQISAIRLYITVNEIKCCRKVTLKGLYGDNNQLRKFIQLFRKRLIEVV